MKSITVEIVLYSSDMFGQSHSTDVLATTQNYIDVLTEKIEETFPGSDITITDRPNTSGTGDGIRYLDADEDFPRTKRTIEKLMQKVFEDPSIYVELAEGQ